METIYDTKIIVALRGIKQEHLLSILEALYRGGIRAVELTFGNADTLKMLETSNKIYDGKLQIGVGTVLDSATASEAFHAGAKFVLTPSLDVKVIETCNRYCIPCIPGAFSPTEILQAWERGASMVKVFPISSVGAQYIKDIRGPFSEIRLMPMGGIHNKNIADFFQAGASAVGIGSYLVNQKELETENYEMITQKAKELLQLVKYQD